VDVWNNIVKFFSDGWNTVWTWILGAITAYQNWWRGIFTAIGGFIGEVWKNITNFFRDGWNGVVSWITNSINNFVNFWKNSFTGIGNFVGSVFNGIVGVVKGPINMIIDLINGMIGRINSIKVDIPPFARWMFGGQARLGFSIPTIPRLAMGGVVPPSKGGTMAQIAEAGKPERVEPLDQNGMSKRDAYMVNLIKAQQANAGTINITVNPAPGMDERELAQLIGDLVGDYENDVSSRKDWIQTYVDGLQLLGMKIEERTEPWEGACGVYHPILSEALVKFQAETMMSTFPAAGPVKTQIVGKETPEKKESATRVQDDMNYELTDRMQEFRPEHERMLWGLGLAGNAFKKVYIDPQLDRQVSMYVPAEDIVVPYGASSIESAERVTHVMRKTENEFMRLQQAGFYRDVELGDPVNTLDEVEKKIAEKMGFRATTDDRYKLLEMQVELDLPGYEHKNKDGEPTGIALPYIITIEKGTSNVLAIRRNWDPEDETYQKPVNLRYWQTGDLLE